MMIVKYIGLITIFVISAYIGMLYSRSLSNRVKDLEEMKNAINLFKAKIKFTYEPIPEVFTEIARELKENIAEIFIDAKDYMSDDIASNAWKKAIANTRKITSFNDEDIQIIANLSKMLGNTDLEGQISMIELTESLINKQIENARLQELKNGKLYKTLGLGVGLSIAIILL